MRPACKTFDRIRTEFPDDPRLKEFEPFQPIEKHKDDLIESWCDDLGATPKSSLYSKCVDVMRRIVYAKLFTPERIVGAQSTFEKIKQNLIDFLDSRRMKNLNYKNTYKQMVKTIKKTELVFGDPYRHYDYKIPFNARAVTNHAGSNEDPKWGEKTAQFATQFPDSAVSLIFGTALGCQQGQWEESWADWLATEVSIGNAVQNSSSKNDELDVVLKRAAWVCREIESQSLQIKSFVSDQSSEELNDLMYDAHPLAIDRLNKIIAAHPAVIKSMGDHSSNFPVHCE